MNIALRLSLLPLPLLLLGAFSAPQPRPQTGCSRERPEFGVLTLHQPAARVTVMRSNQPVEVGTNAVICLGDRVLSSVYSGVVKARRGAPLLLEKTRGLLIPRRRETLLQWLWNAVFRSELLDAPPPTPAGALGDNDPGFLLPSLADGVARVDARHRRLVIPIAPIDAEQRVELWAPGAAKPLVAIVRRMRTKAEFADFRARPGERWQVAIDGRRRILGGFSVASIDWRREVDRAMRSTRLSGREAVLVYACLDPRANGFEAYQLATGGEDAARIVGWQRPLDQLSCATPADAEE